MTTVAAPPQRAIRGWELRAPDWVARVPQWLWMSGFLVILCAASVAFRSQNLAGQYWMDEAITVGISSHSLTAIPGVLRMDGSPPLFYLLLHLWMSLAGSSEVATHSLTLLIGTLCIPIGMWGGWSLFGRRAGIIAAVLFASNAFITVYGVETRMYVLMTLLGLLGTIGFLQGFVNRRRGYIVLFAASLALMFYTHAWAIFFAGSSAIGVLILWRIGDDAQRKGLLKDAIFAFIGAGVVFLPWLPTFLWQTAHTAAPWDTTPHFGAPVQLSRNIMGGDRVTMAVVIPSVVGLSGLVLRPNRLTYHARMVWMLLTIAIGTLLLAWIASHVTPAWVPRYFAPMVPAILLLAGFGMSRAGLLGVVGLVLSILFLLNSASYAPGYKSDMKDVAAEVAPYLHRGDLVIVGQPEQTPLAYYYLPGGLRFANTIGAVKDPSFMNWVNALQRFQNANPAKVLPPLINSLKPGQHLLFIRPLTEGVQNWQAPWTVLVRRRSAQWTAIIAADKQLKPVFWAPHNYNEACCVADSAVLYTKV
jgi:4-amino-4-deoxy-L-arabinose transferase-like glycosyltransferase